jgi:hypothetical protein
LGKLQKAISETTGRNIPIATIQRWAGATGMNRSPIVMTPDEIEALLDLLGIPAEKFKS